MDDVKREIEKEINGAQERFGMFTSAHEGYGVLAEEVYELQLDVIDRVMVLWSNLGETVLTPFMGVGSEVYGALCAGRKAIGMELKPSYYRQAEKNVQVAYEGKRAEAQQDIFEEESAA